MSEYPRWHYFPSSAVPPPWVGEVVKTFAQIQDKIDSSRVQGQKSDGILAHLAPGLKSLNYDVEIGKRASERINRPVLFGDQGQEVVRYEVDAWLENPGVIIEIEAGRAVMGNAFYRDLVRTSLIVNANYLAIAVMLNYEYRSGSRQVSSHDYDIAHDQLDEMYSSALSSLSKVS